MLRLMLQRSQVLDLYFIEARLKLIEIAAFLDRMDRAGGETDYRLAAFRGALNALNSSAPGDSRAEQVLLALSDPTTQPAESSRGKAASGAWDGSETQPPTTC